MTKTLLAVALLVGLGICVVPSVSWPQGIGGRPTQAGQSATILPDGRSLLLGGQGPTGPAAAAALYDPRRGLTRPLPRGMARARSGHTATLLPDGTVLVLGGIGTGGQLADVAEQFDPATESFEALTTSGLTPRTLHTATVLTDGTVLIAGGVGAGGAALTSTELWDPQIQHRLPTTGSLTTGRQQATASLLPDGTVLLWGGLDAAGTPVSTGELYDPIQQRFTPLAAPPPGAQVSPVPPALEAAVPASGTSEVAVDAILALRFSKPLDVPSVNPTTVTVVGPQGPVTADVVPAEGGRLLFVTPRSSLLPGAAYTLTVNGATDGAGFLLPFTSVTFQTAAAVSAGGAPGGPAPSPSPHAHGELIAQPLGPPPGVLAQVDDWQWRGALKNGKPHTRWHDLAPLKAPAGVTALAGLVLQLNGTPLPGVTLQVGQRFATTDATGRFLLTDIPEGYQPILMMGYTANAPGRTYGMFEYDVQVEPRTTSVLPFTIWMPLIDTEHAIALPAGRTARRIVGTTPRIPGLEVHIPAGVTLTTPHGEPLQALSLTPVPTDRTPFPLPEGVTFLVVPQGHGTTVATHDGVMALGGKGVRVVLPNTTGKPPGSRVALQSYDPHAFGVFTWAEAVVSADGTQLITARTQTLGEIGCVWWVLGPIRGFIAKIFGPSAGEPVEVATGHFVLGRTDLVVPDVLPLVVRRQYRAGWPDAGPFGIGSSHQYQVELTGDGIAYSFAELLLADGTMLRYTRTSPGITYQTAVMEHTGSPSRFYKSQLYWVANQGWAIRFTDGTVWEFQVRTPGTGNVPVLRTIRDRAGSRLTFTWDLSRRITRIDSPNGRWLAFSYDASNRVTQLVDHAGRAVGYQYDGQGRLWKVTDVAGGVTTYTYDATHRLLTSMDPRGIVFLTNEYDANGRVSRQTQADGTTFQFAYTLDANNTVTQTDVTNPRGFVERFALNADGYPVTTIRAVGQPETQTTTYVRQAGSNFINAMTDALGRQTTYTYTGNGYLASVTSPGPSGPVTWSYTYEPTFNRVQTITDPLSHVTTLGYDASGNLTTITDPRGKVSTLTYNPQGQPLTFKDPLNHTWTFTYDMGDLVSIKDPTGKTATAVTDAVGRPVALTDALGNRTRLDYDAFNHLTKITDPLGGQTSLGYDPNGNLLSVTDARGKVTAYAPDLMDQVQSRTDPKGKTESYQYDQNGNLKQVTDRKGQPTPITWDGLDRPRQFSYADGSTTTLTWDAGDRLTQVVDSLSGTITLTPDILDRLQTQLTPEGQVAYAYDNADRQTSMTVLGQPAVSYGYDNADRLTSLTQETATVTLTYDDGNRRTSLTLPNGVQATYAYSTRDELTSITFKKGATTLGTLSYLYDAAGRRISIGGTWARTGLPAAVASATYDDANRQLTWGGRTLTYDDNGNLTGDGTNTYTWDARDRLTSISGGVTAAFQYDPFGRRTRKTISGQTTDLLYDGDNPVQEISGSTVLANLLTGLHIDEYFTRTDGSGRRTLLGDALGSILALTDDAGVVQTSYTYEPFGQTTFTGQTNTNPLQYTGRENDGTGLYYYRARYYSPTLGRFIAEDPIGFRGGDVNLYAYVGGGPPNWRDPYGHRRRGGFVGTAEADETNWNNTSGGRSRVNGPTNGNWGGKCWSGGQHSCGPGGKMGTAPPTDSADEAYERHDKCSGAKCDRDLVTELKRLDDDPRRWPRPPRPGTEGDSRRYRNDAIKWFGGSPRTGQPPLPPKRLP